MYSCQCHQIGGPFIAEDPDCPYHQRGGAQDQIETLNQMIHELEQTVADLRAQLTERSWAGDVDRQGGAFSPDELDHRR